MKSVSALVGDREWFLMRLFMAGIFVMVLAGLGLVVYGVEAEAKRAKIVELEQSCVDAGKVFIRDQFGVVCVEARK